MKQNMKKIALALVATNVVASTIITALPPVQTHAAEAKLTPNLKSSSGALMDYWKGGDTQITGRIPAGAGNRVVVEEYYAESGLVLKTFTAIADASGNYVINGALSFLSGSMIRATFDNGITVYQKPTVGDMSAFRFDPMKAGDKKITGSFVGHPNMQYRFYCDTNPSVVYTTGRTDSQGNFSANVDVDQAMRIGFLRFEFANDTNKWEYMYLYTFNPKTPASLPAVAFNVTGLNTNPLSGTTGKMSTSILPASANQNVTYSSSDPSIMKVDANGNWTAVAAGTANIIVSSASAATNNRIIPVTVGDATLIEARTSVNELFIGNDPANHIKDTTNQASINAAQAKVNLVTEAAQKAELQTYVNKAQNELNAREAEAANEAAATASVNDLFIGNNPANHIKDTTNQAAVDVAQSKVNLVADTAKRIELQGQVDKARAELAARTALTDATNSVNNLFSNPPTNTALKDSTTQAMIDAASAQVNALPVSADKTKLQGDVTTANTLFNQIAATTIGSLTTESTTASGKGEPNANIVIKNGATVIASGKVGSDGNYSLPIAKQPANSTVTATATKTSNGKTSSASTVVKDESIVATTINSLTVESNTVSGKGEPNADIVIKNGATILEYGKVASDGSYLFFITKQPGGSTITATVTKTSNGKTSSASTTIVDDAITPTTIGALTADSTSVSGTGEANGNIVIKNGTETIAIGKVGSDGMYNFSITKQAGGSTITATVTKPSNGKTSSASTTIVDDAITPTTINTLTTDSATVSGKGEPNANIVIKNGATTVTSGKVGSDGNYSLPIAKQPANSTVTATATKTSNGKTSSASTVVKDESIVATTINSLTAESTVVSGKGEPNADIVIKNGATVLESGKVASDGSYLFFITKQPGGSTITATVTKPSNGKISSASTTIVDDAITPTTISTLTADSTSVSGTGEANGNIVIKNGAETITFGKVGSDGTYYFNIAKQAAGSTITATVTKPSNGKTSSASTTIVDDAITPTTISTLTADSTSVSGTGEANGNIVIKNGSETITFGKVGSDGTYYFNIAKQAAGSTITAIVTKPSNGKTSSASTTIAADIIAPTTIGALTTASTNVIGTGEANADIVIKNGNTTIAAGKVASNGSYSLPIAKQAAGSVITATVTKASGKSSSASTTIPAAVDYSLTPNSYKVGNANLTGTYGKDIAKVRLFVNGTLIVQATTSNGNFTFANIASYITKPTDKVEVVGVDSSYVERARKSVTVTGDPVYDYNLTANDYTLGNTNLTGKYGKDIAKVRLWVNNVVVAQATTNADGTYSFDKVPSFIKLTTDKVEVVGVNAAYNEVARKTVVTKGSSILDTSVTPNPYAKDSANLTGTFGKDIAKVRLWVNGAVVAQASTSGSNFTFTNIASFIKNKTDIVEVVGVDAQYKELNRKPVTLTGFDSLDNSLTAPADFTLNKDTAINGAMGTNVSKVRLSVNGVIVKQATTSGGTYSIAGANAYITSTSDVVKVIAVDAQYKEVNSKTVTVKADGTIYDYKLNVNPYTFGDATITGVSGKDVAAVRLWVNGTVIKTASLNSGSFTLSGLASITSPTDLVEIVAVNASYKEVARVTIQPK